MTGSTEVFSTATMNVTVPPGSPTEPGMGVLETRGCGAGSMMTVVWEANVMRPQVSWTTTLSEQPPVCDGAWNTVDAADASSKVPPQEDDQA